MGRPAVAFGLVLLSAVYANAQYTLVVDVDGVPENGPDTLVVLEGDTLDAQIWVLGSGQPDILGVGIVVCRPGNVLLAQYSDSIGGAWTISPLMLEADSCDVFHAFDYTFADLRAVPIHVGTASYVVPQGFTGGVVTGSIEQSGIIDTALEPSIVASVPLVPMVDTTAREYTSWTEFKSLWR